VLRKITCVLYAGILSLGCSNPPVAKYPLNPFMVNDYKIDVDSGSWEYSEVDIYPNKYCYYAKTNYNGDRLIVEEFAKDKECKRLGDRLIILQRDGIFFSGDFKKFEKATRENLNLLIRRAKE